MANRRHLPALRNLIGWALLTSIVFIGLGVSLWIFSYCLSKATDDFASGFLSNLAAESLGIGFGILAASGAGWILARNKVLEVTPAIFSLIQRLRIDRTITSEAAQRSVICAVGLLSEGNVRKAISRGSNASQGTECPICALGVYLRSERPAKEVRTLFHRWSDLERQEFGGGTREV
jgi:hypothetical protein